MPSTTPLAGYPFPLPADLIDIATDIGKLAKAIDADPGFRRIFPDNPTLVAGWQPVDGAHAYTLAEQKEWVRQGGVWVDATPPAALEGFAVEAEAVAIPRATAATPVVTYTAIASGATGSGIQAPLTIASVVDPDHVVTQVGDAVQVVANGTYAISMQVRVPGNSDVLGYLQWDLLSPGSTVLRSWQMTLRSGIIEYAFAWTGWLPAGQSLAWRYFVVVSGSLTPAHDAAVMSICPLVFTS